MTTKHHSSNCTREAGRCRNRWRTYNCLVTDVLVWYSPKLLAIVNGWAMSCQLVNMIIDTPSPMYLSVSHYQFTLRFGGTLYVSVTDVHNQSQSVHLVCLGPDVDISWKYPRPKSHQHISGSHFCKPLTYQMDEFISTTSVTDVQNPKPTYHTCRFEYHWYLVLGWSTPDQPMSS